MAERAFEMELDRMYAEAPGFADADLFAARVETRLDRGWTFRRMLIGGLGIAGGLIGGAQILGSGLLPKLGELSARSNHMVSSGLDDLGLERILPAGLSVNGEALWMSVALAILALGFIATRAIKEI